MAILFSLLAVVWVVGSALILLGTAKLPKLPDSVKAQPDRDEDDSGW